MKRVIVADTSLELNQGMKESFEVRFAPFFIDVNGKSYMDDENLDIKTFLSDLESSEDPARTAAPTPQTFYECYLDADEVFVVTISSKLSVTYSNAMLARTRLLEEYPNAKVHVFDSKSAVCGETLVALEIQQRIEENKDFDTIVKEVEERIENMETYFVLQSLDNLVKNGRVSKIVGKLANVLSINPICKAVDGEVEIAKKARGMKAAVKKLVEEIGTVSDDLHDRTLVIAHVYNQERADYISETCKELYNFKRIETVVTKGLSSTYAYIGGIVVAF